MSDTLVTIGRLTASAVVADTAAEAVLRQRLPRLLDNAARNRLPAALQTFAFDAGLTCVRDLRVSLPLAAGEDDDRIAEGWAHGLAVAIHRAAVSRSGAAFVHYASERAALADLVASVALGSRERAWAWEQAGLLDGPDPVRATAGTTLRLRDRELALTALKRRADLAAIVIEDAVVARGLAAVDRLLGAGGWQQVAAVVAESAGSAVRPDDVLHDLPAEVPNAVPEGAPDGALDGGSDGVSDADRGATAQPAPSPRLAEACARSGLRVSRVTRASWAILALAVADPALLLRPDCPAVLAELVDRFDSSGPLRPAVPEAPARPGTRPATPGDAPDRQGSGDDQRLVATVVPDHPAASADAAPADTSALRHESIPDNRQGGPDAEPEQRPTAYAGLLFLLATADDANVPDCLLDDARLERRSLPWMLHRIGTALVPAGADDPGVLAFAGTQPERLDALAGPEPGEDEQSALAAAAEAWASATAGRLRRYDPGLAPTADAVLVARVAERYGGVVHRRGWVEVVLPVGGVDMLVRRAGLDLDPGFVPWLGTVVRYRYE